MVVDGKPLTVELDTGASVSIISETTWTSIAYDPATQTQEVKASSQQTVLVEHAMEESNMTCHW